MTSGKRGFVFTVASVVVAVTIGAVIDNDEPPPLCII